MFPTFIKYGLVFLWLAALAAIFVAAIDPQLGRFGHGRDKMLHIAAYCLLAIGPALLFNTLKHIVFSVFFLIASGAAIELAQMGSGTRTPSFADWLADIAGILAGLCIGFLIKTGLPSGRGRLP